MNLIISLLFIIISFSTAQTDADNACLAILKDGIYDHYSTKTTSSKAHKEMSSLCTRHNTTSGDATDSIIQNSILGLGAGSDYTQDELNAFDTLMCGSPSVAGSSTTSFSVASQIVDPAVINAYQDCLNQARSVDLVLDTDLRPDQSQITIQLRYIPQLAGATYLTVQNIEISPPGAWACEGPLWDSANNGPLNTQIIAMACARNVSSVPYKSMNQSLYSNSSIITIFTNVGSITRVFAPIVAPSPSTANPYAATENQLLSSLRTLQTNATSIQQQLTSLQAQFNKRVPVTCDTPISEWQVPESMISYGDEPAPFLGKWDWVEVGVAFYGCSPN